MKTIYFHAGCLIINLILVMIPITGQNSISPSIFSDHLPSDLKLIENSPNKYLMTAEYINKDIYGNFQSKVKVTGTYTRGFDNNQVKWNDVYIAHSSNRKSAYQDSTKQIYMEGLTYSPTSNVLKESFFASFSQNTDNVYARNLIWDMLAIESYAWDYYSQLKLNTPITASIESATINMADIGQYNHNTIKLNWLGISKINNQLCAIIEYKALDNQLQIEMNNIKSKGSELYWEICWISLENKQIEYAEMYSGTAMEIIIEGMPDKLLNHIHRTIKLEKIQ